MINNHSRPSVSQAYLSWDLTHLRIEVVIKCLDLLYLKY